MSTSAFTVKEIIERIDSKEILLPSMQRKFVWSEEKIINFFDSIMRGYPFGDFIFWAIDSKEEINRYHFYQFIKNYSDRDMTINEKAGKIAKSNIDVVMDGQQRLTSLYIGLKGSLTKKEKHKQKQKAENWKQKCLYIKPYISPDEKNEDETPYRFVFLEKSYVDEWNKDKEEFDRYYKVEDFYNQTMEQLKKQLGVKRIVHKDDDWKTVLKTLRARINDERIINVHTIKNTNINDVLEIFRRINNGGTPLSPSNLLFSTVITSWDDGREEMDEFISSINKEGVLQLKEDFLIKTCLYLLNKPAAAKIEILTKDVVNLIKKNWVKIKEAIFKTKCFLVKHNIYNEAILSYNAIMPIVYFYYHLDLRISKKKLEISERQLFYYFSISQIFSLFGGSSATTLDAVRKSMRDNDGKLLLPFTINNLYNINLSAGRTEAFKISRKQIEDLIDTVQYGDKKSICLLCLLQSGITIHSGDYDVDHICSKSEVKSIIKYKRDNSDERKIIEKKMNLVPNLQLLDTVKNRGDKKDKPLYEWVKEGGRIPLNPFDYQNEIENYRIDSIEKFELFYNKRRECIIDDLCNRFGVTD